MKIILTNKIKNKHKEINNKVLKKYWHLLMPEDYVKSLTVQRPSYDK